MGMISKGKQGQSAVRFARHNNFMEIEVRAACGHHIAWDATRPIVSTNDIAFCVLIPGLRDVCQQHQHITFLSSPEQSK
jgi:hypothetical protein